MLTEKRKKILEYIKEYFLRSERCPTVREICSHFNLKSTNGVYEHLKALEREGYIVIDKNKARGIRLIRKEEGMPILGVVSAGEPIYPVVEEGEYLGEEQKFIKGNFLLKVKGDSMVNAGIYDGDMISIDVTQSVSNNDIVVAVVDGEVTLKRIRYNKDEAWLISENPAYKPINLKNRNFYILGKAKMLIRKLS
jgi:repressor LexA